MRRCRNLRSHDRCRERMLDAFLPSRIGLHRGTAPAYRSFHYGRNLEGCPGIRAREHFRRTALYRARRGNAVIPPTRQETSQADQDGARLERRWQDGSLGRHCQGIRDLQGQVRHRRRRGLRSRRAADVARHRSDGFRPRRRDRSTLLRLAVLSRPTERGQEGVRAASRCAWPYSSSRISPTSSTRRSTRTNIRRSSSRSSGPKAKGKPLAAEYFDEPENTKVLDLVSRLQQSLAQSSMRGAQKTAEKKSVTKKSSAKKAARTRKTA